ncbi:MULTISPECIES: recombinase family protein [unclassified Sphingopyxis]|uniref:recombinase family protein n=1 Tax=unclassified Sphingopyxis TaxID=2614943 RepID=UPI0024AD229D|nr:MULTISPECIES: recombinase family protein [unclassified Sphingopyxis]
MSKEMVLRNGNVAGIPAAQYIRMSTEHQRYSPDNQKAAIASFADARGFEVVKTYLDAGKSGLSLAKRDGLKQLLSDVISGAINFRAILVLDVSRWGRFQDTDQAAHYEYLCREAGVQLHYCAESFENDGGAISSIVKHMKRVMAAEYSRDLSARISRAQRQQAKLGFKMGGMAPYGTRRQVVDENGKRRMTLKPRQRKALSTDKVIYALGPPTEVEVVERVFRDYAIRRKKMTEIARWLNDEKRKHPMREIWTPDIVRCMLKNEIYIGTLVFGRRYMNLGRTIWFDEKDWIRVAVVQPAVSVQLFEAAARRLKRSAASKRPLSMQELTEGLARLYEEKGKLSHAIITKCRYLPVPSVFARRFGSIEAAYTAVGFTPQRHFQINDAGLPFSDEELLDQIRRIHREQGRLTIDLIDKDPLVPSRSYFIARFGGFRNIVRLAGLPIPPRSQRDVAGEARQRALYETKANRKAPCSRNEDGKKFTNEQIVSKLKTLLAEKGYLSRPLINADGRVPMSHAVALRFNGMLNAYAAAGYYSTQSQVNKAAMARAMGTWISPFLRS